jgi:hypothetical protein
LPWYIAVWVATASTLTTPTDSVLTETANRAAGHLARFQAVGKITIADASATMRLRCSAASMWRRPTRRHSTSSTLSIKNCSADGIHRLGIQNSIFVMTLGWLI